MHHLIDHYDYVVLHIRGIKDMSARPPPTRPESNSQTMLIIQVTWMKKGLLFGKIDLDGMRHKHIPHGRNEKRRKYAYGFIIDIWNAIFFHRTLPPPAAWYS